MNVDTDATGNMGDVVQHISMEHLLASVVPEGQCFYYAHSGGEYLGKGHHIGEFFGGDRSKLFPLFTDLAYQVHRLQFNIFWYNQYSILEQRVVLHHTVIPLYNSSIFMQFQSRLRRSGRRLCDIVTWRVLIGPSKHSHELETNVSLRMRSFPFYPHSPCPNTILCFSDILFKIYIRATAVLNYQPLSVYRKFSVCF